jgi:type VI secretion system ImpM family protein
MPQDRHTAGSFVAMGKLPAHGDFLRESDSPRLLAQVDTWLSRGMNALQARAEWHTLYDATPPRGFALFNQRTQLLLAGVLVASRDRSGRRFPFLLGTALLVSDISRFIACAPLALSRLWLWRQQALAHLGACTPTQIRQIADPPVAISTTPADFDRLRSDIQRQASAENIERWLALAGHPPASSAEPADPLVRQSPASYQTCLPVAATHVERFALASLWMEQPALSPLALEQHLLMTIDLHGVRPCLRLSSQPSADRLFRDALISPTTGETNARAALPSISALQVDANSRHADGWTTGPGANKYG